MLVYANICRALVLLAEITSTTHEETAETQPGVFVPKPYEYIEEVTKLVRVLPYEAMMVRDRVGHVTVHQGSGDQGK